MIQAGLELAFPASERPQTHALDRTATGIGLSWENISVLFFRIQVNP